MELGTRQHRLRCPEHPAASPFLRLFRTNKELTQCSSTAFATLNALEVRYNMLDFKYPVRQATLVEVVRVSATSTAIVVSFPASFLQLLSHGQH
jgi:hypothetical protein